MLQNIRILKTRFTLAFSQVILIIILSFVSVSICGSFLEKCFAAEITLSWTRNTEPDIAGYKIYYGTQSQTYPNLITINDSRTEPTQCHYTIYGLEDGQTYYLALKSFDLAGNESTFSQETSVYIAPSQYSPPDNSLTNGTFEEGNSSVYGWYSYGVSCSGGEVNTDTGEWTSEESHSGQYSLKLLNTAANCMGWYSEEIEFDAPYPKTLTFGGWSKALNVQPGGFYCLDFKITFEDGTHRWFYYPFKFDPGTHDWQLKQVTKTWDKGVISVQPYLLLYRTTGTAWFDDIFVIPNPDNVIYNSSLEEGDSLAFGWHLFEQVTPGKVANTDPGEWASEESYSGTHSVKLENQTSTYIGWYGEEVGFDTPYPKTLTFGGWSKALNVQPGGFYCLDFKITFEDGTHRWFYYPFKFDPGTHDWQLKQVTKTWDKGVIAVQPFVLLYRTTGTAWFDDIFVDIN